jgi:hypothetical protein
MKKINIEYENLKGNRSKAIQNLKLDLEAKKYCGCRYNISEFKVIQRTAKVTPKKIGQFVTLWKRDSNNITTPININDGIDYVIIICKKAELVGKFVFPVNILLEKAIMSGPVSEKSGKRGFRLYPEWDEPVTEQARKTQQWQVCYFSYSLTVDIGKHGLF